MHPRAIIDEYAPSAVLFVDDLAQHHASVAEHAPEAWRLHMVGEPQMAPYPKCKPRMRVSTFMGSGGRLDTGARFALGPAA